MGENFESIRLIGRIYPKSTGEIENLSSTTLLKCLESRFIKDKIYVSYECEKIMPLSSVQINVLTSKHGHLCILQTNLANLLITLNPGKEMNDVYTSTTMDNYARKAIQENPPHLYAIGNFDMYYVVTKYNCTC